MTSQIATVSPDVAELRLSLKQPVWHVLVLGIATGKLYFIFWCFKNWRDLANHLQDDAPSDATSDSGKLVDRLMPDHLARFKGASPLVRTIFLLVPYLNNYLFLTKVWGIARLHPDRNSLVARHPLAMAVCIVVAWISLSMLCLLPGAWYFLFLLAALPMGVAQHWLNRYWDSVEPQTLMVRHGFTFKELLAIIGGSLFIGYLVCAFVMGADKLHG